MIIAPETQPASDARHPNPTPVRCRGEAEKEPERITGERRLEDAEELHRIACARCGRRITSTASRIERDGAHEHTRSNAEGLVFRIGCFALAPGCRAVGGRTTYWTWFVDHTWQAVVCGACTIHLGWKFESGGSAFFGLILDRLVEIAD